MTKDNTIWKEASLSESVIYNPSIVQSAKLTKKREKFFNALKQEKDFDNIINQLLKDNFIDKAKRKSKTIINSTFPANICKQCLYKLGL